MSDYRYAVDPAFDDNSEWVTCNTCEREYDRKEYDSDACVECENQLTIKERGQAMNYGTGYGREPKIWALGREALALIECDKIDEREGK